MYKRQVQQLTELDGQASEEPFCNIADVFEVDETGQVVAPLNPDGTHCLSEDLQKDARAWAAHFGHDAFHNHCSNHEHDCTATCVKYVKKKLEAQQSLRASKVPSCRFWFFRIKRMRVQRREKAVRRRGKPLVTTPCIEESDDRNQHCRCQVKREQPFRSASNDVCQVCDRCNCLLYTSPSPRD